MKPPLFPQSVICCPQPRSSVAPQGQIPETHFSLQPPLKTSRHPRGIRQASRPKKKENLSSALGRGTDWRYPFSFQLSASLQHYHSPARHSQGGGSGPKTSPSVSWPHIPERWAKTITWLKGHVIELKGPSSCRCRSARSAGKKHRKFLPEQSMAHPFCRLEQKTSIAGGGEGKISYLSWSCALVGVGNLVSWFKSFPILIAIPNFWATHAMVSECKESVLHPFSEVAQRV